MVFICGYTNVSIGRNSNAQLLYVRNKLIMFWRFSSLVSAIRFFQIKKHVNILDQLVKYLEKKLNIGAIKGESNAPRRMLFTLEYKEIILN